MENRQIVRPPRIRYDPDDGNLQVIYGSTEHMTRYLIDIRLMGPVKQQICELSDRLQEQFRLGNKMVAPHITLAGPFSTTEEGKLIGDFTRVCKDQTEIPGYKIGGYGFFDDSRVVYVTILPDTAMKQFRFRVSQALAPYCSLRDYDNANADAFRFHATLAMKLDWFTFRRIRWYFRKQEPVIWRHHPVRVTLLRNSEIMCEYDFARGRMLTRAQALGRGTMKHDYKMLRLWEDGSRE